jgi:hypothetical protein
VIQYYVDIEQGRVRLWFTSLYDALCMVKVLRAESDDVTWGGVYKNAYNPGTTRNR